MLALAAEDIVQLQQQVRKLEAFCTWSGMALAPHKCDVTGILYGSGAKAGLGGTGAAAATDHHQIKAGRHHQA